MNDLKSLNEALTQIINEDDEIYRQGTNLQGKDWSRKVIDTKEIDVLGVKIKYVKLLDNSRDEDRTLWVIDERETNTPELTQELNDALKEIVVQQLGEDKGNIFVGSSKLIELPDYLEIK